MAEAESHLLNALVTEYLTREAPDTAREFQCLLNSPSPVASFTLEDAVLHFSKTSRLKGKQLGLKDDLPSSKRRKKKVVERPSSGEKKVLRRVSIYIQGLAFCSMLIPDKPKCRQFCMSYPCL